MTNIEYYGLKNIRFEEKFIPQGYGVIDIYYIPKHAKTPIKLEEIFCNDYKRTFEKSMWLLSEPKHERLSGRYVLEILAGDRYDMKHHELGYKGE